MPSRSAPSSASSVISTARSAPIASALRSASIAFSGPIETTTTSPSPVCFLQPQRLLDRVGVEVGDRELDRPVEAVRRRVDAAGRQRHRALLSRRRRSSCAVDSSWTKRGTRPCRKSTISLVGAPGVKTSATPCFFSSATSSCGIVPPTRTSTSSAPWLAQQLEDARHERHVRAGEDRDADRVGVLLDRRLDDLLRRLVQAGVDDLHARVAQRARDDLRAAVVPVEAGLRDHDSDLPCHARAV